MSKIKLIGEDKCEINGKIFDVLLNPTYDRPFEMEGSGKLGHLDQHIDLSDFKGVVLDDFVVGSTIHIFQAELPLEPFDGWSLRRKEEYGVIDLAAWYSYQKWDESYNLKNYLYKLKELIEGELENIEKVEIFTEPSDPGIWFNVFIMLNENDEIYESSIAALEKLRPLAEKAKYLLASPLPDYPICIRLNLPTHLESAFEQYLIYVNEFLRDTGNPSDVSIVKSGAEILLGVKPHDKDVSLKNITEIVGLYLNMPKILDSKLSGNQVVDIYLQKYMATIDYLKSQLRLAEATISFQEGVISSHKSIMNNIVGVIESSIKDVRVKGEIDKVSLFGGAVKIGTWKKGAIEINSLKIIESLRKLISPK